METHRTNRRIRIWNECKTILAAIIVVSTAAGASIAQKVTYGVPTYEWSARPFRDQVGRVRTDGIESEISHILIKGKETDRKVQNRAQQILDSILSGRISFEQAAARYSDCESAKSGGYLGWARPGAWADNLDLLAFSMNAGEVSSPVHSKFGWHIVKHRGYRYRVADTPVEYFADDDAVSGAGESQESDADSEGPGLGEFLLGALLVGLAIDQLDDTPEPATAQAVWSPAATYYQPANAQVQTDKDEAYYARELERLKKQNFISSISGFTLSTDGNGAWIANQREMGAVGAYTAGGSGN